MPKILIKSNASFSKLPNKPGVYWLISGKNCLYVGQSINLNQRWTATGERRHKHKSRLLGIAASEDVHLHYVHVSPRNLEIVEAVKIQQLTPLWNILRPTPESINKGINPYTAMRRERGRRHRVHGCQMADVYHSLSISELFVLVIYVGVLLASLAIFN